MNEQYMDVDEAFDVNRVRRQEYIEYLDGRPEEGREDLYEARREQIESESLEAGSYENASIDELRGQLNYLEAGLATISTGSNIRGSRNYYYTVRPDGSRHLDREFTEEFIPTIVAMQVEEHITEVRTALHSKLDNVLEEQLSSEEIYEGKTPIESMFIARQKYLEAGDTEMAAVVVDHFKESLAKESLSSLVKAEAKAYVQNDSDLQSAINAVINARLAAIKERNQSQRDEENAEQRMNNIDARINTIFIKEYDRLMKEAGEEIRAQQPAPAPEPPQAIAPKPPQAPAPEPPQAPVPEQSQAPSPEPVDTSSAEESSEPSEPNQPETSNGEEEPIEAETVPESELGDRTQEAPKITDAEVVTEPEEEASSTAGEVDENDPSTWSWYTRPTEEETSEEDKSEVVVEEPISGPKLPSWDPDEEDDNWVIPGTAHDVKPDTEPSEPSEPELTFAGRAVNKVFDTLKGTKNKFGHGLKRGKERAGQVKKRTMAAGALAVIAAGGITSGTIIAVDSTSSSSKPAHKAAQAHKRPAIRPNASSDAGRVNATDGRLNPWSQNFVRNLPRSAQRNLYFEINGKRVPAEIVRKLAKSSHIFDGSTSVSSTGRSSS